MGIIRALKLIICMPENRKLVLIFGSEFGEDRIAFEVAKRLEKEFAAKAKFVFASDLAAKEFSGRKLVAIDAAAGIRKAKLLDNLDSISAKPGLSSHGFDLGFQLKLLKKARRLDSVKIIAIPLGCEIENAVREVRELLRSILP